LTTRVKANVYPVSEPERPLHVLFAAPAFWPATAFGGPIPVMRELAAGLGAEGCAIDVVTTSLESATGPRSRRTRVEEHDGATVLYLATPASYRWMGLTPTVPLWLERRRRPDIVHVFGFRDPVGTAVAAWCRARRIPYVFEALGMFRPKLRKVGLKRALDASVYRHVPAGASRLVACSMIERREYIAGGVAPERICVRPNGFPEIAPGMPGFLRSRLGIADDEAIVLAVGRIADGKGLDHLIRAIAGLGAAHLAIVGSDDGHGTSARLRQLALQLSVVDRVHLVGPLTHDGVVAALADADVVALASAHESFGMAAAEAASAGKPILLTDRCGVAELLAPDGALVTPYDAEAIRGGLERLLADPALRARLGARARRVSDEWSWARVVELQMMMYAEIVDRTPAT
jgi:glycosyltransferase involved in cell wall biosynthesis